MDTFEESRTIAHAEQSATPDALDRAKRVDTGLCFILFPLVWVFGFAVHPDLLMAAAMIPYGLELIRRRDAQVQPAVPKS